MRMRYFVIIIIFIATLTASAGRRDTMTAAQQQDIEKVKTLTEKMLYVPPDHPEGTEMWRRYFRLLQSKLALNRYDLSSPGDEEYYRALMTWLIMGYGIVGDFVPGSEAEGYDNILLRKAFFDHQSRPYGAAVPHWEDVRRALAPGEVAVEITAGPEEIFLLRHDSPRPQRITIDSLLMERLALYNPADPASVSEFYSPGTPLEKLWGLIARRIHPGETIHLSAANTYALYNYSAIPLQGGRSGDGNKIIRLTTTASLPDLKRQVKERQRYRSALLVGGVDYGGSIGSPAELRGEMGYLPATLREVVEADSLLRAGGASTTLLTGRDATREAVIRGLAAGPEIVHLATHGHPVVSPIAPDGRTRYDIMLDDSGLLMADANDSAPLLTARDIMSADLSATRLVILSACETALGDSEELDGAIYSLADAFKRAGAGCVIATLWPLPDAAADLAVKSLYANLLQGLSPDDALAAMRREMMAAGYTDPYYWANFVAIF